MPESYYPDHGNSPGATSQPKVTPPRSCALCGGGILFWSWTWHGEPIHQACRRLAAEGSVQRVERPG